MTVPTNIISARVKPARTRQAKHAPAAAVLPTSKSAIVANLLARKNGATVAEVGLATGWQPHSVRAFFSGLRKKGSTLIREDRKDGKSVYRLTVSAAMPVVVAPTDAVQAAA